MYKIGLGIAIIAVLISLPVVNAQQDQPVYRCLGVDMHKTKAVCKFWTHGEITQLVMKLQKQYAEDQRLIYGNISVWDFGK